MRVLGVDLPRAAPPWGPLEHTLVMLDDDGVTSRVERAANLPEIATGLALWTAGDPYLLGVNLPVVAAGRPTRRPVDNLVRRRFGFRAPTPRSPGERSEIAPIAGDTLLAGLAAAGEPCLPYPDRDRRRSGLAESYPGLILKALLWSSSQLAARDQAPHDLPADEELFRAYTVPAYRAAALPARARWADQAVALDLLLRALGPVEQDEFDLAPTRQALGQATSEREVEHAASLLDATLLAGMARRYLLRPETCLFVGDQERGYVILHADSFIRRLGSGAGAAGNQLFPTTSLRDRLGPQVKLRSVDLIEMPGKPQRLEASFDDPPRFEFDNVDEMLWWKHTRHVSGSPLPTEGLQDLSVELVDNGEVRDTGPLKLVRSRHRTLSFRYDPPGAWRVHLPTRDGKTYAFRVMRAIYEVQRSS